MPAENALPTQFAPAERDGAQEVSCQAQAVASAAQLPALLNQVPDLLMVLNRHRQVVYANQTLLQMLGLDMQAPLLGSRPGEVLGCRHAQDMPGGCGTSEACRHCGAVLAILASQEGKKVVRECRLTVAQPDGGTSSLDLQVWASPLEVEGQIYSFLAVSDLSDVKRRQALERIFFHDILNTAGGLHGLARLLEEAEPGEVPHLAASIRQAADLLLGDIQAQRNLLAAESQELQVQPVSFLAQDFLEGQARLVGQMEAAQGRAIALEFPGHDLVLRTDPALLGRVVSNMLKNALEACQPGQEARLGLTDLGGGQVEIWTHNPQFMPRPVQLQVFQRSFSTKGPGRGLGTYSMKLLGERYLKGQVWFTTSQEQGTFFRVRIPASLPG